MSVKEQAAFVTSTVATLLIAACGIATPDDIRDVATDVADTHEDAVDTTPTDAADIAIDIVDVEPPDTIDEAVDVDAAADPMDDAELPDASGLDAGLDDGGVDGDADTDADPWACERRWDFWWTSGYCACDGSLPACCSSFSHEGVLAECRGVTPAWRLEYFHDVENGCLLAGSDEIPLCPWM